MAKDKKENVEKEVKVVDEVKVDEVKVDEVKVDEVKVDEVKVDEVVEKTEGKGKIVKLTLRSAIFEDGTVVEINTKFEHKEMLQLARKQNGLS